jgi:hypothetical protein
LNAIAEMVIVATLNARRQYANITIPFPSKINKIAPGIINENGKINFLTTYLM